MPQIVSKLALKNIKNINVYLTAFGQFPGCANNPSGLILYHESVAASSPLIFTTASATYHVHLHLHPEPIEVTYKNIDTTVQKIWDDTDEAYREFDYIIHIGVGLNGPYQIEKQAWEFGFDKNDKSGHLPGSEKDGPAAKAGVKGKAHTFSASQGQEKTSPSCGRVFESSLDVDWITEFVRNAGLVEKAVHAAEPEKSGKKGKKEKKASAGTGEGLARKVEIEPSRDAGMYTCEYIFRCSLMEAMKRDLEGKALFLHVPPDGCPYSLATGVEVLKKVIEGAVRDGEGAR